MAQFKTLEPEQIRKAIEGIEDVLEGELKKQEAFYRHCICPRCKKPELNKEYLSVTGPGKGVTFVESEPLPRAMLRCSHCNCLHNPFTGMILEIGTNA